MRILRQKTYSQKSSSEKSKTKKDISKLSSGIASGAVLGAATGQYLDNLDRKFDLDYYLKNHPEKVQELNKYTRGNKKLNSAVLNEVSSVITPKTIKNMKKGAKYGVIGGGIISGSNIIRKRIQKDYSDNELPKDWNDTDDKYINLVEKGKRKSKLITGNPDKTRNIVYAGIGATTGLISGYKKGRLYKSKSIQPLLGKAKFSDKHPELTRAATNSLKRGVVGLGISNLLNDATELSTGGKVSSSKIKKQGEKDRESADKVIRKYKRMKTSKEREDFRKKIGVKF